MVGFKGTQRQTLHVKKLTQKKNAKLECHEQEINLKQWS